MTSIITLYKLSALASTEPHCVIKNFYAEDENDYRVYFRSQECKYQYKIFE